MSVKWEALQKETVLSLGGVFVSIVLMQHSRFKQEIETSPVFEQGTNISCFFNVVIYLFLTVLGLRCFPLLSLVAVGVGYSLLRSIGFSLHFSTVVERGV